MARPGIEHRVPYRLRYAARPHVIYTDSIAYSIVYDEEIVHRKEKKSHDVAPTQTCCASDVGVPGARDLSLVQALNSTSRNLDDLLIIENPDFEGIVSRTYPPELQLNKANASDTEAPFLDLHLSISNGFV